MAIQAVPWAQSLNDLTRIQLYRALTRIKLLQSTICVSRKSCGVYKLIINNILTGCSIPCPIPCPLQVTRKGSLVERHAKGTEMMNGWGSVWQDKTNPMEKYWYVLFSPIIWVDENGWAAGWVCLGLALGLVVPLKGKGLVMSHTQRPAVSDESLRLALASSIPTAHFEI